MQKEAAASPDLGMSILCRKVAWEKLKSSQIPAREVTWVKAFLKFAQDNNIQCALTHTQACLHKCERARDIFGAFTQIYRILVGKKNMWMMYSKLGRSSVCRIIEDLREG